MASKTTEPKMNELHLELNGESVLEVLRQAHAIGGLHQREHIDLLHRVADATAIPSRPPRDADPVSEQLLVFLRVVVAELVKPRFDPPSARMFLDGRAIATRVTPLWQHRRDDFVEGLQEVRRTVRRAFVLQPRLVWDVDRRVRFGSRKYQCVILSTAQLAHELWGIHEPR